HAHRADERLVMQVREVDVHLLWRQHPLIDEGEAGEAREVELLLALQAGGSDFVLEAAADDVELSLELVRVADPLTPTDERLLHVRLDGARGGADGVIVRRNRPPSQEPLPLL